MAGSTLWAIVILTILTLWVWSHKTGKKPGRIIKDLISKINNNEE